jgi:Tol biopolymer transport system component
MRADGTARKTLTPSGRDDEDPAWSPDGTRIAFETGGDQGSEVAVLELRTRRVRRVGPGARPAWSPNGKRLVAVDARNFDDLVVMRADGSGQRKLHLPLAAGIADKTRVSWSPDGKRLAFVGNGLWVVRPDGTGLRRIRREGLPGGASWSPDGKRIAFDCVTRHFESCTVAANGSGLHGLTHAGRHPKWSSRNLLATTLEEPADGVLILTPDGRLVRHLKGALSSPDWSPDGRRLVMAFEVATNTRLYATGPTGKSDDRLTARHGTLDQAPVWSPDGTRIAFRRHRPGRCSIDVLDPRMRRTRVLVPRTKDRFCDDRPDWARGRGILYESAGDLWVVSPRGGGPRRITSTRVAEAYPRWAPHGEIGFLAPGGIWVRHANGSRSLLVPNGGPFAWSRKGASLAYAVYNAATDQADLYVKAGSGPPRKLFAGIDGAPSWSPDDRRLVFSHTGPYPEDSSSELVVVDLNGTARGIGGGPLGDPDWRPR